MKAFQLVYILGVAARLVIGFGQIAKADQSLPKWSEKDLLRTGQALSIGTTLTSNLQEAPIYYTPPTIRTMQDFGIDSAKIDPKVLNNHVVEELRKPILDMARSSITGIAMGQRAAERLGAVWTLIDFNRNMWNAYRVGTGRAEPDVLKSTIPHVVMAWDAMKGPKNTPIQTFISPINYSYNDGSWKSQTWGTKITHQEFSTTAPGKIGHYGFDPYTDNLLRRTSMQTIKIENFDGSRFNRMYQNTIPKIEPPKFYTPPIRMYQPPPIQRYQPPPIQTYRPVYTPPPSYRK